MRFYYKGIALEVPESVYYPHDDSILLAEVLEKEQLNGKKALDLCCGSGLLAIVMAKAGATVTAADINKAAIEATRANAEKNSASIKAVVSDLFSSISERFDVIACNPPYLPEGGDAGYLEKVKQQLTSGETGRELIEKLVPKAKQYLNKNGKLFLLVSSLTGEKEVLVLLDACNFSCRIAARKKVPWEELIVVEAVKG